MATTIIQKIINGTYVLEVLNTPNEKLTYGDTKNNHLIDQLVKILATPNSWQLLAQSLKCIGLGKKANGIHPLTAWEFMLETEEKRQYLRNIYIENPKKTRSIIEPNWLFTTLKVQSVQGFISSFQRQKTKDELQTSFVLSFCKKTGLDPMEIGSLIYQEKWEKLIESFIPIEY